jgi:uncharacterized membrane protein
MPATTKAAVAAIFDHFESLSFPRIERNKLHSLHEMVVVALCAAICGAEGWADVERSTAITAVSRLLALLELTGAVVTLDAMHCQTATAAAIRQQQADYLLTVKQNQPKLRRELLDTFIAYEEQCELIARTARG